MGNNLPKEQTIAIVGGGAAGLMAAYFAQLNNPDSQVILIEKNKYLGAKVIISGGGRCNVTTALKDIKKILENYPRGAKFLQTALYNFPPQAVMDWFESQGVPLKTEELKIFPVSNNGHDIVDALEKALRELSVKIILNQQIINIEKLPTQEFQLSFHDQSKLICQKLILTTGGNAYRQTGSSGDGYTFAKNLGHTITPLAPSLFSFTIAEDWTHQLSGISLPKAKISLSPTSNSTKCTSEAPCTPLSLSTLPTPLRFSSIDATTFPSKTGPILFTHQGLTGPTIFALSALLAHQELSPHHPLKITLDFFPDLTSEQLDQTLQQKFLDHPTKKLNNILGFLLPHRLADLILDNLPTSPNFPPAFPCEITSSVVPRELRKQLIHTLKNLELTIIGRGKGDEFVTAGGVDLMEVDFKTMQSKITPGLFFAGELLDLDGFTGGFNLQASWATGALAGENLNSPFQPIVSKK